MDSHSHIPLLTSIITIYFFFLTTLPQSHSQENDPYRGCRQSYNCGTITKISYPFFGENRRRYCGSDGFELECWSNQTTFIRIGLDRFKVLQINQTAHTMRIVREEIFYNGCEVTNTYLNTTLFRSLPTNQNVTIFYGCESEYSKDLNNFKCPPEDEKFAYYLNDTELPKFPDLQKQCRARFQVPALPQFPLEPEGGFNELKKALEKGFDVEYIANWTSCEKCFESGGICGSHMNDSSQFFCHFRTRNGRKWNAKAIVGVSAAAAAGAIAVSIAFYFFLRQKKKRYATSYEQSRSMSSDPSLKDPEKGSKYFGLPLFTYDELEEATNYFDSDKELGDGGFGTVYFGKLRDGRLVAVKRLYENNYRRLEQFMNEVEILTRLRHQNLVSLYGCTSRHSRELLLVYEYISNGTVADHLHGEQAKPRMLPWNVRMSIAIETATALTYLHASDIIHRDVKTNNILLDNHFVVKVADFGLSRLFPTDVTHISTAPQGTPGYVDPEYHECYQLTDKSDVYSFGVVLIELISSLPAVDITRHRHEINLSNMAITKIQNRALHELVDPTIGFESDYKVRKMINAVAELAFQCLQNLREMRPSMEEVLGRLKEMQSDGQDKTKAEEMDISPADDVVLLKNEPPPASPDSHLMSIFTTPNASG